MEEKLDPDRFTDTKRAAIYLSFTDHPYLPDLFQQSFSTLKHTAMEQSRKKFLRHLIVGTSSIPLIIQACKKIRTTVRMMVPMQDRTVVL